MPSPIKRWQVEPKRRDWDRQEVETAIRASE